MSVTWFTEPLAVGIAWLATLVGVLVSLVGFGYTLRQVSLVKSAADASQEAISALKIRFQQFDAIHECAQAENCLNELRFCVQKSDFSSVERFCDNLETLLINICENISYFDEQTLSSLSQGIENISEFSRNFSQYDKEKSTKLRFFILNTHRIVARIKAKIHQEQA